MSANPTVLKALAVTAQVYGKELAPEAAVMLAEDLSEYAPEPVLASLSRCRRELRVFPTVADILSRIDDGRPGPEQAWAMVPKSESESCVWTDEMCAAYGIARRMLDDDAIAARVAFKEAYLEHVRLAREARTPIRWSASFGHDRHGRDGVVLEAVHRGRLTHEVALQLIPDLSVTQSPHTPRLGGPRPLSEIIAAITDQTKRDPEEPA